MARKKAIVVGSRGQDGKLLCQLLAGKDYLVTEIAKGLQCESLGQPVDILDSAQVMGLVAALAPDEIYYLAAHHQAAQEKTVDESMLLRASLDVNVIALQNFLEAIRVTASGSRLFYAASSHIFGSPEEVLQDEKTVIAPTSFYGISKAAGTFLCRYYRSRYGMFASVGILYNHESIHRDRKFISKKIANAVARIKMGLADEVMLGNLNAAVDWGYAPDYVDAMNRIVNLEYSDDFVIATGELRSVRELAQTAFAVAGLDYRRYVKTDDSLVSGSGATLCGNSSKLTRCTGWEPSKTFGEMVMELVEDELKASNER